MIPGENVLEVNIATTLWNVLRPIWTELRAGGVAPGQNLAEFDEWGTGALQDYGIIGEVQIVPHIAVEL